MDTSVSTKKSPLKFFILVTLLALPFWLLGALPGGLSGLLHINLPFSALGLVTPFTAALILTYRTQKWSGVKQLLSRIFDYKRARQKLWYLVVLLFNPVIVLLSYGIAYLRGVSLPAPQILWLVLPLFFVGFFIGAIGEETGWSGYAIDPLQDRWGALRGSLMLGAFWALWHLIPFIQTHNSPTWVIWQSIGVIVGRVIITWLYNNTGRSLFAAILCHTMNNVAWILFFNYSSSYYDPVTIGILLIIAAVIVTFFWGAKTLAHYRFAHPRTSYEGGRLV